MTELVLTQPEHQAAALAARIRAQLPDCGQQLSMSFVPLLRIDRLNVSHQQQLAALELAEIIICSSPSVVRCLPEQLPQAIVSKPWYCPGEGSARALRQRFGVLADYPKAQQNSEALLAIESLRKATGERVLFLTGTAGRRLLEQTLTERGFEVVQLALYCRRPLPLPTARIDNLSGALWLISSAEALDQLSKSDPDNRIKVLVTSQRLAQLAADYGYNYRTATSNKPEHIARALQNMDYRNRSGHGEQKQKR